MAPASGRCSRIISRSSVDLPEPLPPTMAKISARRTSRSRPECTMCPPKRVETPLTSMTASWAWVMSEVQCAEGDREEGVGDDHQENRLDNALRGLAADAVGAAPGAKSLETADH